MSYLAMSQEVQCYLYILQLVEPHATFLSGLQGADKLEIRNAFINTDTSVQHTHTTYGCLQRTSLAGLEE